MGTYLHFYRSPGKRKCNFDLDNWDHWKSEEGILRWAAWIRMSLVLSLHYSRVGKAQVQIRPDLCQQVLSPKSLLQDFPTALATQDCVHAPTASYGLHGRRPAQCHDRWPHVTFDKQHHKCIFLGWRTSTQVWLQEVRSWRPFAVVELQALHESSKPSTQAPTEPRGNFCMMLRKCNDLVQRTCREPSRQYLGIRVFGWALGSFVLVLERCGSSVVFEFHSRVCRLMIGVAVWLDALRSQEAE